MYIDLYLAVALWTFAIFGMVSFMIKLYKNMKFRRVLDEEKLSIVIFAKDSQDIIEGMVLGFIDLDLPINVILIDEDSQDETARIMSRLEKLYEPIKFLRLQDLPGYIEKL
ncbi:MAG: glycosyltransferase family 2 protein [Clostridiales bacterium]|nr:glycosyltransferase family 2 protein [Clostridiales bacterium]